MLNRRRTIDRLRQDIQFDWGQIFKKAVFPKDVVIIILKFNVDIEHLQMLIIFNVFIF